MITIHEAKAADFTTLGLGALLPSECTVRERAGGMYELKIVHPITEDGRHHRIKPMRIIKAPAPARETPLVEIDQVGTVARDIYKVVTGGARLNMRAGASMESKVLHAYRPGTEVCRLGVTGDWMQVAVLDGGATGWMWANNLEYVRTETDVIIGDAPGTVVRPRQTREQLFRIYRYSPDTKERAVTAEARHITYDLAGAVVEGEYSPENVPADQVCAQIMARADHDVSDFHIYCTVSTPISGEYGGRNILDCLLDPETGIVAQAKARIVRDNYDIFILPDEVRSRGVELRYGKNLLSAYMDTDVSDTITRIKPVGKTRDGEKLYIEENGGWVESPYISDYPVVYSKEVEYDVVESDELPIDQARMLLKEKAEADFLAGCDMATVKLDADFVRLELTEDYKHLANQYALHLYDSVPVIDRDADIVAAARMTEYAYDAILDEYQDTGLGELDEVKSTIYGYELAAGTVSGGKLIPNTVNGDRLQNLSVSYAKFDLAAIRQLAADAIVAIRADIRKLVAGNITTDQLYADLAVIAAAQITAANIEKANIQWAEIENLAAEIAKVANAEIGNATIDYAKIVDAAIDTAIITEGVGGKLYINRLAVTEANMVQLTVGALMLKTEDGRFVRLIADGEGGVRTELVEVEGENVADATISGGKLIENTITARELNVDQIFADQALIRAIRAANIDVADLFAAEATIAALDAYIIKTSTIEALKGSLDIWAEEKIKLGIAENPASSVKNGSGILIDKDQVRLFARETLIAIPSASGGEETVAKFDEDGVTAVRVQAGNLTYRYNGPTVLYVNPDATSDQLAGGAHFRSLTDACASLNNRTLTKSVTIRVLGDSYGDVVLNDICGGSITIHGGGHSLIGTMEMSDCTTRIYIYGLSVTQPASSAATRAMWIINCRYVAMEASVRISGNGGAHALVVEAGSAVWLYNVELYNATNLLYAVYGTHITALNLKGGNCTNFAWANGCILKMAGSRPDGELRTSNAPLLVPTDPTSLLIDSGSAQPSVPTVQTASWNYTESDSYADGWSWIADDDVRQGYNGKRIYGVFWFDAAAIRNALNGRTINQASLRLYMMGGVGRGVSVKIQMYGTNKEYEGRSGAPALIKSYGTIGSAAPGEINEIAIPVQAVADIVSGATRALVLYSDDTALYKDRGYSTNYARFSGSTSADASTCPRLTVAYQ